jgi:hypothetical protein
VCARLTVAIFHAPIVAAGAGLRLASCRLRLNALNFCLALPPVVHGDADGNEHHRHAEDNKRDGAVSPRGSRAGGSGGRLATKEAAGHGQYEDQQNHDRKNNEVFGYAVAPAVRKAPVDARREDEGEERGGCKAEQACDSSDRSKHVSHHTRPRRGTGGKVKLAGMEDIVEVLQGLAVIVLIGWLLFRLLRK